MFDVYQNETFKLRAMIFCTINEFSAYGNLSRYSIKGYHACLICEEGTSYLQLQNLRKIV